MFDLERMTTAADASSDDGSFYELAVREGWTEGLPVAVPTSARVGALLAGLGREAATPLGAVQDDGQQRTVTYGDLAACALMAGCGPEHGPVVAAAAEAVLTPDFRLASLRASGGAFTPLVIISGGVVEKLGFATGHGVFTGGGKRANMAVGRAIALLVHNVLMRDGAGRHQPDLGGPNLFFSCIAEAPSHWGPLHAVRGYPDAVSGVTVIGAGTHNGEFLGTMRMHSGAAFNTLADGLRTLGNLNTQDLGGEAVVCLSQPNMEVLVSEGWSRRDVQDILFQLARRRVGELRRVGILSEERLASWRAEGRRLGLQHLEDEDERLPVVDEPDSVLCVPCGGETMWWACVVHGAGRYGGRAVTRPVQAAA